MNRILTSPRLLLVLLSLLLSVDAAFAASRSKGKRAVRVPARSSAAKKTTARRVVTRKEKRVVARRSGRVREATTVVTRRGRRVRVRTRLASTNGSRGFIAGGPWNEPNFADATAGDVVDGEDLNVRRAAVDALGGLNGSVVVADPQTGRILTIVNQKLAFRSGFQPCSTIKIVAAMAGLSEGVIDKDSPQRIYGRASMNLTNALARSNNPYFANIGIKLGYDKIAWYARTFGLGEKAGLNIPEEQAGVLPDGPPQFGGMGMMTSFGEGIKLTPLQLSALVSAIANGGTLYYLQYPRSAADIQGFTPQVKRHLDIKKILPELTPGLLGATEYGTARRAAWEAQDPIFGKTGTCTDRDTPTHLGWFGSYSEVAGRKLSVVVLLTGGRYVNGPAASGVAGQVYKALAQQKVIAQATTSLESDPSELSW